MSDSIMTSSSRWTNSINGNNFLFLTLSSTEKTTKTTQYNDGQFKSRSSVF